jgi:hypothetical protein
MTSLDATTTVQRYGISRTRSVQNGNDGALTRLEQKSIFTFKRNECKYNAEL